MPTQNDLYRGSPIRSVFYKHCFTRSVQEEGRETNQKITTRAQIRNTEDLNSFVCSMSMKHLLRARHYTWSSIFSSH